ncbi:UDP-glucose 4-epimerase GalE [Paenibacillus alvei]|uniref:UDP-glucose 4-epimerase GalE n=1 Tax=Paenibacillus alvei TaxID=44250 RepID=UPI000289BC4E|nr:UDP-glucose 4-epimerase GalE [Paenibacillus alvei]EJW17146.1 UDP-glucose 4-epimerase GalE [Paenibacillus alvei DSM 29]MCY9541500.1 UDP-glucose 4-epimerase GalE [Paenibacillus alvei]MCY9705282.1 UDP-glucose 4-epimerase GalE [Paenibacillus alvei]MCY9735010.1 UDP-glucose 4-epimerase GalE [Paenibacillus alvei]MCY9754247.1 UDP-glucose 4-epimerase GalE [Paenibacillus alvei]
MAVLVTGGAGYIGSHTVAELLARGEEVVIVDSLETGHQEAVLGGTLHIGDIRDSAFLDSVFAQHSIDAVIHFAAYSLVGESMSNPAKYYDNNVHGTLVLLEAMRKHHVSRIVFSSTAATYGEPERTPIQETEATNPTNVYGETKLTMERMMRWFDQSHEIRYVSLRYFNAAGAHENGKIGEDHRPETHLIPLVLQTALGQRKEMKVFGSDYPTPDGTCIRDYIHVSDLADAHVMAVEYLRGGGRSDVFNLGSGNGFSVLEVIQTAERVTGRSIPTVTEERRAGDPAVLIASADKAKSVLGWSPKRDDLNVLIQSAWNWHQARPTGYDS